MMGKIYVNIEDLSMVYVIDASMMKVIAKYSLGDGKEPSGLALDTINHRIFSVCDNKLMVILDANTGKIITTMPIGDGVDGCAYDYGNKRIYASCGDGNLTIVQQVNADKYKLLGNLPTMKGARTLSVSQRNHHIYLPSVERGDAPVPTPENPNPRPIVKPNTFVILDIEPIK
jgi:DNA-binding beta-propeller fold protein YncE